MLFTTARFFVFLAAVIAAYYLCPPKRRWCVLLAASAAFYAFSGLQNLACLTGTTLTAYAAARLISSLHEKQTAFFAGQELTREEKQHFRAQNKKARRLWLIVCLLINLGFLAFVKYDGSLLMPMGISFYTFQSVGYLIDVYRGAAPAQKSLPRYALFASFFPQMIQGPISRYNDLAPSLFGENRFDAKSFSYGLQRVLLGFFKKLVIADRLLIAVRTVTQDSAQFQGAYTAVGILLYAVTLYADFTGGIDITIGVAQALGIKLRENFNRPFYAVSIADYWRRWHITMGTWFKDYLFYPLSTAKPMLRFTKRSRKRLGDGFGKRVPVYVSTITVWFATGAWHGASANFIVWGLVNGFVIILSEECSPLYKRFHNRFAVSQKLWYRAFIVVRTFCLMSVIRSFDIFPGVGTTLRALGSMFTNFRLSDVAGLTSLGLSVADYIAAFTGVALLILCGRKPLRDIYEHRTVLRHACIILLLLAVIVFGMYGIGYDANQFIYNRF